MKFQWVGANGAAWDIVADWDFYGAAAAGVLPGGGDMVFLIPGYGPLITGNGTANAIDADAPYTLTGAITLVASGALAPQLSITDTTVTITGSVNDAPSGSDGSVSVSGGQLVLSGASDAAEAQLTSTSGVLGQSGGPPSEAAVSLASWTLIQDAGDSGSGSLDVGQDGAGILTIGNLAIVAANTAAVGTEAAAGTSSVLSLGPSGTLSVAGALTVGGGAGFGTLIDDGSLAAGSLTFGANSDGVVKGFITTDSLQVDAGALVDGAGLFSGPGSAPNADTAVYTPVASIVDDGTIEGAISIIPMTLDGPVTGSGTLLIDSGGAIAVLGSVASTIAVRFVPGAGAIDVAVDGAAGGNLELVSTADLTGSSGPGYNLAGFAATIYGFAPGDAIDIDTELGVTSGVLGTNNLLSLLNSGDAVIGTLQLDPNADYANDSFLVQPANYGNGLIQTLGLAGVSANMSEIVVVPDAPSADTLAAPVLTLPGSLRTVAGTGTAIPPISVVDAAGFNDGEIVTVTLSAASGTFAGVVNLDSVEAGLLGTSSTALFAPASDGSQIFNGQTLTLAGIGTSTLSVTSTDLTLVDMQLALIQYVAGPSAGSDTIDVTVTASGTGTGAGADQTATGSIPVAIGASGTAFTWTGVSGNGFDTAANWSGSVGGPPGAGDIVTFGTNAAGAPSYAVTGDGTGGQIIVTANVLFQGEVGTGGGPADEPALVATGGGIAGFAGIATIDGDTAAGYGAAAGTIDFYGILQTINGNLIDGDGGAGDVQIDGAVQVAGDVSVGVSSTASMELGAGGVGLGAGQLIATNVDIGVESGVSGTVTVSGGSIVATGTLTVGDAGTGTLIITRSGNSNGSVQARSVVIGAQGGSSGTVTVTDPSTSTGTDFNDTLANVSDTLTVGEAGSGTLTVLGTSTLLIGVPLGYATDAATAELDIAALPGSTGLVTGDIIAPIVAIGGTAAAPGGQGTYSGTIGGPSDGQASFRYYATQTMIWGNGVLQGSDYSTAITDDGVMALQGGIADGDGTLTINPGASLQGPGAIDDFTTVENGGTIAATTGALTIEQSVSGTGTLQIDAGATLGLIGGFAPSQTIAFTGAGKLEGQLGYGTAAFLPRASGPAPLVTGFTSGSEILLSPSGGFQQPTIPLDPSTMTLTPGTADGDSTLDIYDTSGGLAEQIRFAGLPTETQFSLMADANGDDTLAIACFARGTRIATSSGEVAVEHLRVGDRVLTAEDGFRPIGWIGQRRIDPARHPKPHCVLPVRIRAGAFGVGRPHRDLFLSPDHAVYVEDVLIPVQYLINGGTIRQLPTFGAISYFHIELDRHDILFADGLAVESYLETGNRAAFENGGPPLVLHPDFRDLVWEVQGYAPLIVTGPKLESARRLLVEVAAPPEPQWAKPARAVAL